MPSRPWRHRQALGAWRRFADADEAATMVEYSLVLAFVSLAAVALVTLIGPEVADMFQTVVDAFSGG